MALTVPNAIYIINYMDFTKQITGIYKITNLVNKKVYVGLSADIYEALSKSKTGLKQSAETIEKRRLKIKGMKREIIMCPHCGTKGGSGSMKQWHFTKCKYNESI